NGFAPCCWRLQQLEHFAPRGNGRGKIADLFCPERFAASLAQRNQALQFARKTRSGFPLLASAWPRRRRHHGRRLLSEQLDRRNFDPAFRIAGNPSSAARTRCLRLVLSLVERIDNRRARARRCHSERSRGISYYF